MPELDVGWREQASTEVRTWLWELAGEMDVGDVVGTTTATLTDLLTGADVPLSLGGAPVVIGTTVAVTVLGLAAGHKYRLALTSNMGADKETAVSVKLDCPW